MKLIAGLGNPGSDYHMTRHNVGFWLLEHVCADVAWDEKKRLQAQVYKKGGLVCAKPTTFMNESGQAVAKVAQYFDIPPHDILVIHDEIDVPLGEWKLQFDRGSAGHNGVQSVIDQLGTKALWRLRLGIRPQRGLPKNRTGFVLKKFNKREQALLHSLVPELKDVLDQWIKQ